MSGNLAMKLEIDGGEPHEALQQFGTVASAEGQGAFVVRLSGGERHARRAVSCLVEPEIDDRVLVALEPRGDAFILAILERRPGAPATLTHDGDLNLRVGGGKLGIVARDGATLVTGADVSVVSNAVKVTATDGEFVLERLGVLSSFVRAELGKTKVFGSTLETVVDRATQRVKRAFRFVEEIDQLRTKQLDYTAEQVMQLHAGNAVVTAEQLVKVDGEQIHLG